MDDPIVNVKDAIAEVQRVISTPEFAVAADERNKQLQEASEQFLRAWSDFIAPVIQAIAESMNILYATILSPEVRQQLEQLPEFHDFYELNGDSKEAARKRSRDDLAKKRRDFRQRKGKL